MITPVPTLIPPVEGTVMLTTLGWILATISPTSSGSPPTWSAGRTIGTGLAMRVVVSPSTKASTNAAPTRPATSATRTATNHGAARRSRFGDAGGGGGGGGELASYALC